MDAAPRDFVDRMAMVFAREGLPGALGSIIAYLLIADGPRCLEEIATDLSISKASASLNTRLLEHYRLLERVPSSNRRFYYQVIPDVWAEGTVRKVPLLLNFSRLAGETWRALPDLPPAVKERLVDMEDFYAFFASETPRLVEKWRATREEKAR